MVEPWTNDPADEGRGRQGDTGARKVIQWTSKAWTAFELKLPVFYRESLARLLALERYRNLIETNITAGITLYTDHKPGLFENSLSNKGQLSAWRLLLSIVENLYRTGGKMLLADVEAVCTERWLLRRHPTCKDTHTAGKSAATSCGVPGYEGVCQQGHSCGVAHRAEVEETPPIQSVKENLVHL